MKRSHKLRAGIWPIPGEMQGLKTGPSQLHLSPQANPKPRDYHTILYWSASEIPTPTPPHCPSAPHFRSSEPLQGRWLPHPPRQLVPISDHSPIRNLCPVTPPRPSRPLRASSRAGRWTPPPASSPQGPPAPLGPGVGRHREGRAISARGLGGAQRGSPLPRRLPSPLGRGCTAATATTGAAASILCVCPCAPPPSASPHTARERRWRERGPGKGESGVVGGEAAAERHEEAALRRRRRTERPDRHLVPSPPAAGWVSPRGEGRGRRI